MRSFLSSLEVLREREFRLLWLGGSLSSIGDALVPVAAAFAVLEIGTATDLGIVLGAYMGGRLVFTLVGGVWADRLPRRLIMIASDAVRAAVQAVLALAFFTDAIEVWHLAVGSTIFGISGAFFGPASTGLIPQIVSAGRIQEANALRGMSRNVIELFGPAAAGVLVATAGYAVVYVVDAASFVASLACLALMRPLGAAARESAELPHRRPRGRPRGSRAPVDARDADRRPVRELRDRAVLRPRPARRPRASRRPRRLGVDDGNRRRGRDRGRRARAALEA